MMYSIQVTPREIRINAWFIEKTICLGCHSLSTFDVIK